MGNDHSVAISGPKVYTVNGEEVTVDEDGFLVNPESWSEELARILAEEEGITELSDTHWRVLKFWRTYYFTKGKAPLNSQLKKGTGLTMAEIQACFPEGCAEPPGGWRGCPI